MQSCHTLDNLEDSISLIAFSGCTKILELLFESDVVPINKSLIIIDDYFNKNYADLFIYDDLEIYTFLSEYIHDEHIAQSYCNTLLKVCSINTGNYDRVELNKILTKLINICGIIHIEQQYIHILSNEIFFEYIQNYNTEVNYKFLKKCMINSENEIIIWSIENFKGDLSINDKVKLILNFDANNYCCGGSNVNHKDFNIIFDYFNNLINDKIIYDMLINYCDHNQFILCDGLFNLIPYGYKLDLATSIYVKTKLIKSPYVEINDQINKNDKINKYLYDDFNNILILDKINIIKSYKIDINNFNYNIGLIRDYLNIHNI